MGESLPSRRHGVIVCFEGDFFFVCIDDFFGNSGSFRFSMETH